MRRNRERDQAATYSAQAMGWSVVRVWECEIKADAETVALALLEYPVRKVPRRRSPSRP